MDERKCPKCGHEMELKAGVVLVCIICGHVERLEDASEKKDYNPRKKTLHKI